MQGVSDVFGPIPVKRSRSGHIADRLEGLIANGILKPGDKLPSEHVLCKRFQVSRSSLREAVHRLQNRGLLKVAQGRGSFVAQPADDVLGMDIALICHLKGITEREANRLRLDLQRMAIRRLSGADLGALRPMEQYALVVGDNPESNIRREKLWLGDLALVAEGVLLKMLVGTLCDAVAPYNQKRFEDSASLLNAARMQQGLMDAIMHGSWKSAEQICVHYFLFDSQ